MLLWLFYAAAATVDLVRTIQPERLQLRGCCTQVLIEFHRSAPQPDKTHYGRRRKAAIPCWPRWPPPWRSAVLRVGD